MLTPPKTVGTCFGFAVRSPLPFHYLRAGEGEPLDVSAPSAAPDDGKGELILEWTPTPTFPFEGRLYRGDPGFRLWTAGSGWFLIDDRTPSVTLPDASDIVRREERLWSIPAILCLRARGDIALHAAAVEVDGEALVLGAPRTFGKTTLAAAFHSAGHRLLAEDVSCLRISGRTLVIPGPAMLRLRHDVAEQLEIPNARPIGEVDDRVHLAVDTADRGDCLPVPVRAVILLRHADHGFRLERVPPPQAVRDIWTLSFRLAANDERARSFAEAADLARSVPVWNLYRPLQLRDLAATVGFLVENLR